MNSLTTRYGRGWAAALVAVVTLLAWVTPQASAQYSEYEVKARLIINFAKFSSWPPKAFADASAPFTIVVLGSDSFGAVLEKACQSENIGGRKVSIRRTHSLEDVKNGHLVFVAKSEKGRLGEMLSNLQGANVLTVGESDQFARQGGAIGFVMNGDKVGFEINPGAVQRAGVKVSSQVLKLGKIVSS